MRKGPELNGVRMKWSSGYYDGPLNGLCEYKGKFYYFECCGEEDLVEIDWNTRTAEFTGYDRLYNVRKIPWWLMCFELVRHRAFIILVRRIGNKMSMWLWYGLKKSHFDDYGRYEIIGWCADDKEFFEKAEQRPSRWKIFGG